MDYQLPYNERKYIRIKVDDVLMVCMEDSSAVPIQKLVESLVIVGPESLGILREILSEISLRRAQVRIDQEQVYEGLITNLESMGVKWISSRDENNFYPIRLAHLQDTLKKSGIQDDEVCYRCVQLWVDSHELINDLRIKLDLLDRMEQYLADWIVAVYYLSAHQQTGWTNVQ